MKYHVELSKQAKDDLRAMHRSTTCILLSWMTAYLEGCRNPRVRGGCLKGENTRWRYTVGKYRLLAQIDGEVIVVLAVRKQD